MPPQHTAFPAPAPIDRPALFSDPTLARGAAPSTLEAQAANLSRGEPPVVVPPPAATEALPTHATPAARPKRAAAHAPSIPKRRPEATASTSGAGGFQVQIGAFQSQAEAERQLAAVRERAGGLLARGTPVALQVQQGQKVFYRARYSGFDAQTAIKACAELKRLKVECLVAKAE
jgi:D-alanyl-D-alanine carboxypeptidase